MTKKKTVGTTKAKAAKASKGRVPISSVICFVLAGLMLALFGFMQDNHQAAMEALKSATYIGAASAEGVADGTTVILNGVVDLTAPATDPANGLTFPALRVGKHTTVLTDHYNSEKKKHEYSWDARFGDYFCGEASVGGFALSKDMLDGLPISVTYTDYDFDELAAAGLIYYEDSSVAPGHFISETYKAMYIDDFTTKYRWQDLIGTNHISKYVGCQRTYYTVNEIAPGSEVTVIGVKNGAALDVPTNFTAACIYKGAMDVAALEKQMKSNANIGNITCLVIMGIFLAVGIVKYANR